MGRSRYNVVAEHVLELLEPIDDNLKVKPKTNCSTRELQLFWKYHGYFANDFARGVAKALPDKYEFVSYDHLNNKLEVKIK